MAGATQETAGRQAGRQVGARARAVLIQVVRCDRPVHVAGFQQPRDVRLAARLHLSGAAPATLCQALGTGPLHLRLALRVMRRPWLSTEWHNTAKVMLAGAGTTARTLGAECAYWLPRGRFHTLTAVGMLSRQGLVLYATRRAHDIFEEDAAGCVVAHGNGRARVPVGQEVPDLVIVDFDVAHLPRHVYLVLCVLQPVGARSLFN